MYFHIDDEKLLKNVKPFGLSLKSLNNWIECFASLNDDRYLKTKIRTYVSKVYTNVCDLNVPEWYRMWIFYNHFYWFFIWLRKQILSAHIIRQLCL